MSLKQLENLVKIGQLKSEPFNESEYINLVRSGEVRLNDAKNPNLSLESRFDLAYNAAHSLSLAALRKKGYRSNSRYVVFQVLPYTLDLGPDTWRVLDLCHNRRNVAEYEGYFEVDERLLEELINVTCILLQKIISLNTLKDITGFLKHIEDWAKSQNTILGVALTGSYARNQAHPDSDIDIVILAKQPDFYLIEHDWINIFGEVESVKRVNYGILTSLHVHYKNSYEVEFGVTTREWINTAPVDEGTKRVVSEGIKILYDPDDLLNKLVAAIRERS